MKLSILKHATDRMDFALRTLFRNRCPICEVICTHHSICAEHRLQTLDFPFRCLRCNFIHNEQHCLCKQGSPNVFSAFAYDETAKRIIHRIKYSRERWWLKWCLQQLPPKYSQQLPYPLISIPMYPWKEWDRGYNLADDIAQFLSSRSGKVVLKKRLVKIKRTSPQSTLDEKRRQTNLRGSFKVKKVRQLPERLILVDDILTSGSTLKQGQRCLKRAGVKSVFLWSLFRSE